MNNENNRVFPCLGTSDVINTPGKLMFLILLLIPRISEYLLQEHQISPGLTIRPIVPRHISTYETKFITLVSIF